MHKYSKKIERFVQSQCNKTLRLAVQWQAKRTRLAHLISSQHTLLFAKKVLIKYCSAEVYTTFCSNEQGSLFKAQEYTR